jgi:isoleucyl-tRNA synthetase
MFRPVNSKVNFPQVEENILQFWKQNQIFEKSVELRRGSARFTLYEGPPTANGNPGVHHVLSRVFKDVIPRYKTMKGYYAPRKAGWDTHGLPVELEVEKKLGFTSKADIENYGVDKFNALCRESVFGYLKVWNAMTERIGYWLDLEHPYITLDNTYIESCWWALRQLWDKGLIYQGYRVTPHCPRCGTSLSSHEVALGYKDDAIDPSVYVKFRIIPELISSGTQIFTFLKRPETITKPMFLLAWTTTPWTLPGNTALAVSPASEYWIMEGDSDYLLLASAMVDIIGLKGYQKVFSIKGEDIIGIQYEPLFNPHNFGVERRRPTSKIDSSKDDMPTLFELQQATGNLTYRVIGADFVSMDEGTGIVHIAPAFGEVDFEAGKINCLDFVQPVDLEGRISGNYTFSGKFVKDADPIIIDDLQSRGLLFRKEKIVHTYPFCWRCEAPLLYYAKKTWYIRTNANKADLIAGNAVINWYPEHIKNGRFGDWLENNIDWAFSRERYWGTPLNIWNCPSCGNFECIGGLDDLKSRPNLTGLVEPLDLHRPYVDAISFACSKCGNEMKRQPEVIDCWFDSGAMPIAQWHYPFENKDLFAQCFPADFICEAVDQTRGWFYSLHALSTLLFKKPCYKNVICLGHILDAEGEKMSKAKGNVVDPWTVLNSYGADATRWYLLTSSPPGNVRRFSSDIVSEVQRNFLLTLWNTYSFFIMYANIDKFDPKTATTETTSDLDKWVISGLNQLILDVEQALDSYDPTTAGRKIENFVSALSNWYVRRSRRRFWKSQGDADKLSAYSTLYHCLVTISKLTAPLAPFIAEEIYQNLVRSVECESVESVHMTDFPVADRSCIDKQLMDVTSAVMTICSLGRAARAKAGIKVRQPLSKVFIKARSISEKDGISKSASQILEELNVKEIDFVDKEITGDTNSIVAVDEGDFWVAVSTELSAELEAEGTAREVVRRLQTMRRSAGLDITDHINICYQAAPQIQKMLTGFVDYIKQETLSQSMIAADSVPEGYFIERHRLLGTDMILGIEKQ